MRGQTRLFAAARHVTLGLLLFVPLVLVFPVMLIAIWRWVACVQVYGLFLSDSQRGAPTGSWLFIRKLPYSLPFQLAALPLALVIYVRLVFGMLIFAQWFRLLFEVWMIMTNVLLRGRSSTVNPVPGAGDVPPPLTKSRSSRLESQLTYESSFFEGRQAFAEGSKAQEEAIRFVEHSPVFKALSPDDSAGHPLGPDVRLLSLRWLLQLGMKGTPVNVKYGGVLHRRQELPEEAFLSAEALKEIAAGSHALTFSGGVERRFNQIAARGCTGVFDFLQAMFQRQRNPDNLLPIVAISYCWLEKGHPDRHGHQISLLCDKLKKPVYGGGKSFLEACVAYGFSDMGVFLDWASLFQHAPDGGKQRSDDENAAFKRALETTMDLWYAHASTTVVLLTQMPQALPPDFDSARSYSRRGWTTFERCGAELGKSYELRSASWPLVIDVSDVTAFAARRLPTTPDDFDKILEERDFTSGADKEEVKKLYRKMATGVLGSIKKLDYQGLPVEASDTPGQAFNEWDSPEKLAKALNLCQSLRVLNLRHCRLTDKGTADMAKALDADALPSLIEFNIRNRYGADGVRELCEAFGRGVGRNTVHLMIGDALGDAGAEAFGDALRRGLLPRSLRLIDLSASDIGTRGAQQLARGLCDSCVDYKLNVNLAFNRIGVLGQRDLLLAVETTNRNKGRAMFASMFTFLFNGFLPPFDALNRAFSRGHRMGNESGRAFM